MPVSDGPNSMFVQKTWDETQYTKDCQTNYGLTPDYDWAFRTFGGANTALDFKEASNIIFSNGVLDPWRSGGVTDFINSNLPYYVIRGGAHHLDLRLPTKEDAGTDVEWVRNQEMEVIRKWIMDYQTTNNFVPPTFVQK